MYAATYSVKDLPLVFGAKNCVGVPRPKCGHERECVRPAGLQATSIYALTLLPLSHLGGGGLQRSERRVSTAGCAKFRLEDLDGC